MKRFISAIILIFITLSLFTPPAYSAVWLNRNARIVTSTGTLVDTPTGDGGETALAIHIEHIHHTSWFHPTTKDDAAVDTLNGTVAVNSKTLILDDATGFTVGDIISLSQDTAHTHMYRKIIAIVTNTLTIDSGIDFGLNDGSTVQEVIVNMAVDGSSTPVIFEATPKTNEVIDILRLLVQITDATEPDDSKFGALSALTNGVHLRKNINNGASYQTIAIWRTNGDMKLDMFNVDYSSKAGGGNWGVSGRWTIIESGAIINIDDTNNEKLEVVIQDDLTGLVSFEIKWQGHIENGS